MKKWLLIAACCWLAQANAQQQGLQNLYFFDLAYVNAAYAGHHDALSASTILRKQWVGFNGAPETFALALHSPLRNQNMALGLNAHYERIGPRDVTSLAATYAYRIRLREKSRLSFALRAGAENHRFDFDKIDYRDENDPIQWQGSQSNWMPVFDFAVLATGEKFFGGLQVSNLAQARIRDVELSESRQFLHATAVGGYLFVLSDKVALKPNALVRYAENAPVQIDLNLHALFMERFWLGAGYRHQYGMLAMLQFRATDKLEVGYAYDFALNPMRNQHAGSHELYLSYRFNVFKSRFSSPRYF